MKYLPAKKNRIYGILQFAVFWLILPASYASAQGTSISSDLAYFKGTWTVNIKDNAKSPFTWTVAEDLKGEWLNGVVADKDGAQVTKDFWRINGNLVERFAFTAEGLIIKVVSYGWRAGTMTFNGLASGKGIDFRIRETITKTGENRFRAVWEKQGEDGKWRVISDEICSK